MKQKKLFIGIAKAAAVIFGIALVVAIFCIAFPKKHIIVFAAAAAVAGLALVALIIFALLYYMPGKALKRKWAHYATLQPEKITDFKAELEAVRSNFSQDTSTEKNEIEIVKSNNFNHEKYFDFSVIKNGKIYYAYLVEANSRIFRRSLGRRTLPGVVVYSPDEYFESNPYGLQKIAEALFKNRANNVLRSEAEFFSNIRVKCDREVYMTSMFFYRPHLPLGYMGGALLPVIADPANCPSVFAVDDTYWTEALVANFVHNDFSFGEEEPFGELN